MTKEQLESITSSYYSDDIKDSGAREEFGNGAVRDTQEGKGRFDLISPVGTRRLARRYELGAVKYGDRNWQNGMPIGRCIDSALRHLTQYMEGDTSEDHLAAVAWNVFTAMHMEEKLPGAQNIPERPGYVKRIEIPL